MQRKDIPSNGNCEVSIDSIEDNKYVVINTKITENKKEHEKVEKVEKVEKDGFMKRLKRFFNKKKGV